MAVIDIERAISLLKNDDVVAIPTETVYGLAGRIGSEVALKKIFLTKQRPFFDPLIIHVASREEAKKLSLDWPPEYNILSSCFWPGPLTLVTPKNKRVSDLISAGLNTVALRVPHHPIAKQILFGLGEPFAAPSANRFGHTSPTQAEHVESEFSGKVHVVDGGPCTVGLESTVVRLAYDERGQKQLQILRPGMISREDLAHALAKHHNPLEIVRAQSQASPGHLLAHYQPRLPLVIVHKPYLSSDDKHKISHRLNQKNPIWHELKLSSQPTLAAREMYSALHQYATSQGLLYFLPQGRWEDPKWESLVDRLSRACTLQWPHEIL